MSAALALAVLAAGGLAAQTAPGAPRMGEAAAAEGGPGGRGTIGASRALEAARATQDPGQPGGLLTGGIGLSRVGEDWFASVDLGLSFDFDQFGFGLQLPVRFRVVDEDPPDDDDLFGIVRGQDWDSVGDVLKILRYVYVGQRDRKGPYYFRLGLLDDLTLGHGTIVHRYRNDVDVNRWRVGFEAAANVDGIGAHAFVGDLTAPYLSGLRVSARPLEMALGKAPFLGLEIGASVVVDASAPLSTCLSPVGGELEERPTCLTPAEARAFDNRFPEPTFAYDTTLDDQERPRVAESTTLAVLGVDVGYEILNTGILSITPYVDLNKITTLADGWGFHAGVLWNASLPAIIDTFVFDLRTEYRNVSGDYRGPYVNGTYEIERFSSLRAEPGRFGTPTKLAFLCGSADGSCVGQAGRHGYFVELLVGLPKWIFLGGELLDYTGDRQDGTFRLTLEIPALQAVQLSASYFRVGVRGLDDLFGISDRSAILARARVPLYSVFALDFEWSRVWRGDDEGGYQPVDDWRAGVGFAVAL